MSVRVASLSSGLALSLISTLGLAQDTSGDDRFSFHALLSGAQVPMPPEAPSTPSLGVFTPAGGEMQVFVSRDLSALEFHLSVTNGVGIIQAHLHCARAGENGPIVMSLIAPNVVGVNVEGVLAEGIRSSVHIEPSAIECEQVIGRPVRNIASLLAAALDGLIFVSVHTVANPAGEIRGQLISSEVIELEQARGVITNSQSENRCVVRVVERRRC